MTLPAALPSGDYLFRTQQLAIHNPGAAPQVSSLTPPNLKIDYMISMLAIILYKVIYIDHIILQFYISCAQLTVTDGGAGTPGPLVAIPGAFKNTDPGYVVCLLSFPIFHL